MCLALCGLHVLVQAEPDWCGRLRLAFRRHMVDGGSGGSACGRLVPSLYDERGLWRDESAEPRVVERGDVLEIEHRDFVGHLAADGLTMRAVQPARVLSTDNALRVLLGLLLLRNDGLLLHAAGVVRAGGATVLFGASGSGKSTVARLARGRPIVGDDLVALRRGVDGWTAHTVPLGGGIARSRRARSARLAHLYRLRQAPGLEVVPLRGARAVAELLASVVLPAGRPADRVLALERCADLATTIGAHDLYFPLDRRLWGWLDERGQ